MAPVMSILAAAQRDIMELSGNNLKDKLKRFNKVPNVGKGHVYHAPGGHARARPTEWGILAWNRNFICSSSVPFQKNSGNYGRPCTERHQPALPTSSRAARSTWPSLAFLNLFAAFSTTSDKRQVLQMADDFPYNVPGFEPTCRDLVELFGLLDHTVMTT